MKGMLPRGPYRIKNEYGFGFLLMAIYTQSFAPTYLALLSLIVGLLDQLWIRTY